MPGIDITVTQLYDKAVVGGLDYAPSYGLLSGYEHLVAKPVGDATSIAVDRAIKIEPLLRPDQWFLSLENTEDNTPRIVAKKGPVDDGFIRFNKEFQTSETTWEDIGSTNPSTNAVGVYFLVIYNGKACWACKYVTGDDTYAIYVKASTANQLSAVNEDDIWYIKDGFVIQSGPPTTTDVLITIQMERNAVPYPGSSGYRFLLDSVHGPLCAEVQTGANGRLRYEEVDFNTDVASHKFITIEPYFHDGGKLDVRLSIQEGTLASIAYPYLAGFVDPSTGRIDGLFFVEDITSIATKAESYPNLSFAILQPKMSGVADTNPAVFPFTGKGPVWTEYELYAGNVSGAVSAADDETSWFASGEAGNNSDDYTLIPKALVADEDPNSYLRFTSWRRSGGAVNIDYSDLTSRELFSNDIKSTIDGLHKITDSIDVPVIVDNEATLPGTSERPFYMCYVVAARNKKTSITSGVVDFSKKFDIPYPYVIAPYSNTKVYKFGEFCLYEDTTYVYMAKVPGSGVPPTDTNRWATDATMVIEGSVTARVQSITAETFVPDGTKDLTGTRTSESINVGEHLINTRALRCTMYTQTSRTGIQTDIDTALFPGASGNTEYTFTRRWADVPTNFYGSDLKNGQTMVYPIFNLYRGITNVIPERDSLFSVSSGFSLFGEVATNIFPYIENETANAEYVVTVTDSLPVEPLTGYTYILTYSFSPSRSGAMRSDEYVCQTFNKTSGITLFRYDTPTVNFGLNDSQYVSSYVEYLESAEDQSVTQTIEAGTGERHLYIVLGETTGNTFEDGNTIDIQEANGGIGDINATILGYARVPAEYYQYAPTFSGTARLRFRVDNDTDATNDLYTANSPTAIAAVQNATTSALPSVTWAPSTDAYTVHFFTIISESDISTKLKTLLFEGNPFSFKRYQVLATATIPASMKDIECELITNFRLDFT